MPGFLGQKLGMATMCCRDFFVTKDPSAQRSEDESHQTCTNRIISLLLFGLV